MSLQFVNVNGDRVSTETFGAAPKRKTREQPESFRNGWRVVGIPPGALEAARTEHARLTKVAQVQGTGKLPKPWDEGNWLMNAKRKPVRAKPYEVPQAAQECAALATKAGWLCVEAVEIKKEAKAAA